jgi:chemotaxis protein methyltransferase CheR
MFGVAPEETEGRKLYDLGSGQWNIPALRHLLEEVIPQQNTIEAYEVEHRFPQIGRRIMLLNARKIVQEGSKLSFILLAIDDVTARRDAERERDRLAERISELAQESAHRIKNSFMILSSFARLQRKAVASDDAKQALRAIESRIDAIARLYEGLSRQEKIEGVVSARLYLESLCDDLRRSVIAGTALELECDSEELDLDADRVVTLGLAVNELVMNAVKHAFANQDAGKIGVRLHVANGDLLLNVRDNGRGVDETSPGDGGLGQKFLSAFVGRLRGNIAIEAMSPGTSVTIRLPIASPNKRGERIARRP